MANYGQKQKIQLQSFVLVCIRLLSESQNKNILQWSLALHIFLTTLLSFWGPRGQHRLQTSKFFFCKSKWGLIMVAAGDRDVHGGEDFYIWCVQFNKTYKDWKTASGKIIIYPLRCQCPGFQCQIFWQHPIVRKHLLHLMALVGVWWLDQRN